MTTPYASIEEVERLVENVNVTSQTFKAVSGREAEDARRKLQVEAGKLLYSLQEPNTEVWPRIFQVSYHSNKLSRTNLVDCEN